jgi:hypothetical protein
MNPADRVRLQQILATFDEAGLVALSNKGLVRRAAKDLEATGLAHEETDTAMLVRGPGWVVTMPPDGPAHATDDTRATGVTRQILTATLYLRDHWAEAAPSAVPVAAAPETAASTKTQEPAASAAPPAEAAALQEALLALDRDDLEKWAGKTVLREVLVLVDSLEIEVETHAGVTIRLLKHEVEARLLPVRGKAAAKNLLDQVLTTAPKALHRRWVVSAVLAFQQSRGIKIEKPAAVAAPAEAGAARSREGVLAGVRDLLEGMVTTGLAHPSARMLERLFTLSVSAVAVHLPRLGRLLRSLADEVSLLLTRDASADTTRFFELLCLTHALARALAAAGAQPPVTLAGQHRSQYDLAGDLRLAGVGAHPWVTASGFEGLTVLLWDEAGKRFLTWTASRPVQGAGRFSIEQTYRTEAVWSGSGSPERFSRSHFTLRQAKVNPQGRLSGTESSTAIDVQPTDPGAIDFGERAFTNWLALLDYARSLYPVGLAEKNPLDRLVVLRPVGWGERFFDEMQQRFCWPLPDDDGNVIPLTLPWAGVNESAIEFLEAMKPERDRLTGVVVRLSFGNRGVLIEPLSLLSQGTPQGHCVLNPAFDLRLIASRQSTLLEQLRKKYGRDRIATTLTAEDDEVIEPAFHQAEDVPASIQVRLSEAEQLLLRVAESGLGRLDDLLRERLKQLAADLERRGLAELGASLAELARSASAVDLVGSGYLSRLHRECVSQRLSGQAG